MYSPLRIILLTIYAVLAGASPLCAEAPRWNVTAECDMITLPQKAALALIPELQDETKIEAAFARLQAMIERKEATLVAHQVAKGRDGEKVVVETVEEFRYATAYHSPEIPPVPAEKEAAAKAPTVAGVTPSDFETRNLGVTLEMESKALDGGRALSVDVTAQHVLLHRMEKFDAGRRPDGKQLSIEQPQFGSFRDTCSMLLRNGQRVLLGVHKFPGTQAETMEICLLKVSAVAAP